MKRARRERASYTTQVISNWISLALAFAIAFPLQLLAETVTFQTTDSGQMEFAFRNIVRIPNSSGGFDWADSSLKVRPGTNVRIAGVPQEETTHSDRMIEWLQTQSRTVSSGDREIQLVKVEIQDSRTGTWNPAYINVDTLAASQRAGKMMVHAETTAQAVVATSDTEAVPASVSNDDPVIGQSTLAPTRSIGSSGFQFPMSVDPERHAPSTAAHATAALTSNSPDNGDCSEGEAQFIALNRLLESTYNFVDRVRDRRITTKIYGLPHYRKHGACLDPSPSLSAHVRSKIEERFNDAGCLFEGKPNNFNEFMNHMVDKGREKNIPPELLYSIMYWESDAKCQAANERDRSIGSYGLFQLSGSDKRFGRKNSYYDANNLKRETMQARFFKWGASLNDRLDPFWPEDIPKVTIKNKTRQEARDSWNSMSDQQREAYRSAMQSYLLDSKTAVDLAIDEKLLPMWKELHGSNTPEIGDLHGWHDLSRSSQGMWRQVLSYYNGGGGRVYQAREDLKNFNEKHGTQLDANNWEDLRPFVYRRAINHRGESLIDRYLAEVDRYNRENSKKIDPYGLSAYWQPDEAKKHPQQKIWERVVREMEIAENLSYDTGRTDRYGNKIFASRYNDVPSAYSLHPFLDNSLSHGNRHRLHSSVYIVGPYIESMVSRDSRDVVSIVDIARDNFQEMGRYNRDRPERYLGCDDTSPAI